MFYVPYTHMSLILVVKTEGTRENNEIFSANI